MSFRRFAWLFVAPTGRGHPDRVPRIPPNRAWVSSTVQPRTRISPRACSPSSRRRATSTSAAKYDTASEEGAVTHYTEIISEKARPRCDVFWNNEILSTIRLQRQGLLDPYDSPNAAPFAKVDKADDHTWCAFATRARVLVVNTKLLPKEEERPHSLLDLAKPKWKDKVVMAQPQYGTTATQAACLFEILGSDKAKEYYRALKANGVALSPGNKQAAEWAGKGKTPAGQVVAVGVTDTDDAMEEIHDNPDVVVIFPDRDAPEGRMGTLYIPNTVCILKGCPNSAGARKLVDFLLSPEVEKKLAEEGSHQIPLNPNVKATLPPQYVKPTDKGKGTSASRFLQGGRPLGRDAEVSRSRIRRAVTMREITSRRGRKGRREKRLCISLRFAHCVR